MLKCLYFLLLKKNLKLNWTWLIIVPNFAAYGLLLASVGWAAEDYLLYKLSLLCTKDQYEIVKFLYIFIISS